jgi:hypothetical protein
VRTFRQYFSVKPVALVVVEAIVLVRLLYFAAHWRYDATLDRIETLLGPLWPRARIFAAATQLCMVAMGLYGSRLCATFADIVLRIATSVIAATAAVSVIFYAFPRLHLGRGLLIFTAFCAVLGIALIRFAFARFGEFPGTTSDSGTVPRA